jgi:hypothetical protein
MALQKERSISQEGKPGTPPDGAIMSSGTEIQSRPSTVEWYGALTGKEKRTFWTCFRGGALDAMDVQIFSFAITAIIASFHISKADAGLVGTVTLLTSACSVDWHKAIPNSWSSAH